MASTTTHKASCRATPRPFTFPISHLLCTFVYIYLGWLLPNWAQSSSNCSASTLVTARMTKPFLYDMCLFYSGYIRGEFRDSRTGKMELKIKSRWQEILVSHASQKKVGALKSSTNSQFNVSDFLTRSWFQPTCDVITYLKWTKMNEIKTWQKP